MREWGKRNKSKVFWRSSQHIYSSELLKCSAMEQLQCQECLIWFASKKSLSAHNKKGHGRFPCTVCDKRFNRLVEMTRHRNESHRPTCQDCGKVFAKISLLKNHSNSCQRMREQADFDQGQSSANSEGDEICGLCGGVIKKGYLKNHLISRKHIAVCLKEFKECDRVLFYKTAFKNHLSIFRIMNDVGVDEEDSTIESNCREFLLSIKDCLEKVLKVEISVRGSLKFRVGICGKFYLPSLEDAEFDARENIMDFVTPYITLYNEDEIESFLDDCSEILEEELKSFQRKGSGWSLLKIEYCELSLASNNVFKGSSFIELPKKLRDTKACVNVINREDDLCFVYSVLCHTYGHLIITKLLNNPKSYVSYFKYLDLSGIEFPLKTSDIRTFERNNPSYSFVIFSLDENSEITAPIYKSKEVKSNNVRLLLLNSEDFTVSHYVLIRNLSRIISHQLGKNKSVIFCESCLSTFPHIMSLNLHLSVGCRGVKVKMPTEPFLSFKKRVAYQRHMFVMYGDCEALLAPYDTEAPDPQKSNSQAINRHIPVSICYSIKTPILDPYFDNIRCFTGLSCMDLYCESIEIDSNYIYDNYISKQYPIDKLSFTDTKLLASTSECSLCGYKFGLGCGVRDHNHMIPPRGAVDVCGKISAGNFRSITCFQCNLQMRKPINIVTVFHNLSYDCNFLLLALARRNLKIKCIALNRETPISFATYFKMKDGVNLEFRYLCSYRHLTASLASLVKNLKSTPSFSKLMDDMGLKNVSPTKQFLPYSYFTSFEKLEETSFPEQKDFFSDLTQKGITEEDYAYAKRIFLSLKERTLLEYLKFYNKSDVALLSDVFENYRNVSIALKKLDSVFFCTSAGLSYNNYLSSIEGGKVHLIEDSTLYNLIRKNIRGGVVSANVKHCVANNPYIPNFDPTKPTNYIMYVDATALYATSMMEPLPSSDYRLLETDSEEFKKWETIILNEKLFRCEINSETSLGLMVEFDCEIDKADHDRFNCFPFLPELVTINKVKKLLPNLQNKSEYFAHYTTIQMIQKHKIKITKIRKIVVYKQNRATADYVKLLIAARQQQTDLTMSLWLKLMLNMLYGLYPPLPYLDTHVLIFFFFNTGKMIQTDVVRIVILVTAWVARGRGNWNDARRLISSPRFKGFSIFAENFVALEMQPTSVTYDKSVIQGFSILEISKKVRNFTEKKV